MKKLLVAILAVTVMSLPAISADGGGKKKARKKAKTECKKVCTDPKGCDVKDCDPACCDYETCPKSEKCPPKKECAGS